MALSSSICQCGEVWDSSSLPHANTVYDIKPLNGVLTDTRATSQHAPVFSLSLYSYHRQGYIQFGFYPLFS